jgi:hypothetical protein
MELKNEAAVLGRSSPRLVDRERRCGGEILAFTPSVAVLRGPRAVAGMRSVLVELCRSTGQAGAMDALELFLNSPSARAKIPYLLLVGRRQMANPESTIANDLDGAVLIYEYRIAGRGTGVFATDDVTGERTLIAPAELRTEVAEIACRKLLNIGAKAALISFNGRHEPPRRPLAEEAGTSARMAIRTRVAPGYLALAATFQSTLATLGDNTRRNFRRYRRRVESDLGAVFVPSVEMGREQFLEINRTSTNPLCEAVAEWHYDTMAQVGRPVFCGLRAADGRWLSLIGGFRSDATLHITWQLNLAGMPRYSLTTVMRSFLMEFEVDQRTTKLIFEGGTPHPMRHSLKSVSVVDMIVQRKSPSAWLLRKFSRWIFPEKNFLGHTLRDDHLRWTDW